MITPVAPAALASALAGSDLGRDALKFLTVMAFVDGSLDQAKIASVLRYASALGIAERYLDEIREAAHGRLQEVLADMTRCNMESITAGTGPMATSSNGCCLTAGRTPTRRSRNASRHLRN